MIRINGQRAQFLLAATTRSRLVDTDCLTSNEICRFHLTRSSFKCSPSADDTDDDAAAADADAWTAALTAALVAVALASSAADGRAVFFYRFAVLIGKGSVSPLGGTFFTIFHHFTCH